MTESPSPFTICPGGGGDSITEELFGSQPRPVPGDPEPQGELAPNGSNQPLGEDASEYFLELIIDTLEKLEPSVQGAFLQKFLASLAGVEVSEGDSLKHWQGILQRRKELAERLNRYVTLRTAAVDYFGTALLLRNPILLEYRELKRLRQDAATDPLTGLYNRRLFREALAKELSRSQRYGYPLGLLLFDLRNFKGVNDTYGHAVGDKVLAGVARACTETIRGSDLPCRIGGDEFALLLPQSDGPSARALAQRVLQKFEEYALPLAPDVGLGLDYGVASFPEDGESPATLFDRADRQLYTYKRGAEQGMEGAGAQVEPPRVIPMRWTANTAVAAGSAPEADWGPSKRDMRRYERISLEGTGAYGVLRNGIGPKMVRLVDLSFGGFSFLLDEAIRLPDTLHARLHAPLLPPAEYRIHRVYELPLAEGLMRVGCRFAS